MLLLEFLAISDPTLRGAERPVLQLADQLRVERDLLGGDGVQVADAVHVALGGGHVQRRVVVVVQTPHVGTESHQEGQAVVVAVGSRQVERRVAPDVTLVRVTSGRRMIREAMLIHCSSFTQTISADNLKETFCVFLLFITNDRSISQRDLLQCRLNTASLRNSSSLC